MVQIDNNEELFPIVTAENQVIGSATRAECHGGSLKLHPVVHLHLFNSKGELYLQKRPAWKDIQPNRWDTAVGGHVAYGEQVIDALHRESFEEIGIKDFIPTFIGSYIFESERERELVNIFTTIFDGQITPSAELDGGRFWSKDELRNAIGKGILTPNFEGEISRIISL